MFQLLDSILWPFHLETWFPLELYGEPNPPKRHWLIHVYESWTMTMTLTITCELTKTNLVSSGAKWGTKSAKTPLVDGGPAVLGEAGGDGNCGQDCDTAEYHNHSNLESAIAL